MTQLLKKISWEEQRHVWSCVGKTPQRLNCSLGKSDQLLGESLPGLAFGSKFLVACRVGCNCLQFCGCKYFAKDVGRALLGRRLALTGPMGQCASAHSIHLLERPGEVWAAWRPLFLPYQEAAGGGFERRAV